MLSCHTRYRQHVDFATREVLLHPPIEYTLKSNLEFISDFQLHNIPVCMCGPRLHPFHLQDIVMVVGVLPDPELPSTQEYPILETESH